MTETVAIILAAMGSVTPGEPAVLTAPTDFTASLTHLSTSAGARGTMYFMGSEDNGTITSPTVMDDPVLGFELFRSHGTPASERDTIDLGLFGAGESLQFAYLITRGSGDQVPVGTLFTTTTDPTHFRFVEEPVVDGRTTTYTVGVEDIPGGGDLDFNDVIYSVTITEVPAHGSAALAVLAGLTVARRRRR